MYPLALVYITRNNPHLKNLRKAPTKGWDQHLVNINKRSLRLLFSNPPTICLPTEQKRERNDLRKKKKKVASRKERGRNPPPPANPTKHSGSDPEAFWIRPVMAITASVQLESGRIVYARSDLPHPFQHFFFFFFFLRHRS